MKPKTRELVIFKTVDGVLHFGEYTSSNNKWVCEVFIENYYDRDVIEWWNIPESGTGQQNLT